MTRFYHILLFFLAPLFFVGIQFVVELFSKKRREFAVLTLLLVVLVPYFLFQTEFIFEVTNGDSYSVALSGYRMDPLRLYDHYGYADEYSVHGAKWLSANVNTQKTSIYADERNFANNLRIYSLIYGGGDLLSNRTVVKDDSIVYLSKLNVIFDKVRFYAEVWNTSQISYVFDNLNMIYANGGGEVYECPP
jgi:uncharacterized membrane protein